jgi:uncharacterized protein YjbK
VDFEIDAEVHEETAEKGKFKILLQGFHVYDVIARSKVQPVFFPQYSDHCMHLPDFE